MRVLWFCNKAPAALQSLLGNSKSNFGGWLDTTFLQLRGAEGCSVAVAFPGAGYEKGLVGPYGYYSFNEGDKTAVRRVVDDCRPDVVHVWGTEFKHSLHALEACREAGILDRCAVSIQGLVSIYGEYHYLEGIPPEVARRYTFRDFVRHDNILQARDKFVLRGIDENKCLSISKNVIGRTEWDKACCQLLAPQARYHFCNESLREPFYVGEWDIRSIRRHSIFVSQCGYPIKGFHFLLEALPAILERYPDTVVYATGPDLLSRKIPSLIRQSSYQKYLVELIRKNNLEGHVEFLGVLGAEDMKGRYLSSHAFVSASTVENSSNSIAEAMILGCPVVASNCGGTSSIVTHEADGLLYQTTAPYMLAYNVMRVFDDDELARSLSENARARAAERHDACHNFQTLLSIYASLSNGGGDAS